MLLFFGQNYTIGGKTFQDGLVDPRWVIGGKFCCCACVCAMVHMLESKAQEYFQKDDLRDGRHLRCLVQIGHVLQPMAEGVEMIQNWHLLRAALQGRTWELLVEVKLNLSQHFVLTAQKASCVLHHEREDSAPLFCSHGTWSGFPHPALRSPG